MDSSSPSTQPPWINPSVYVVDVCIQVCQPRFEANGVLADVCSCFGRVVAEAVVSQPRLPIKVLPLKKEGDKVDRCLSDGDLQPS